MIGNYQFNPELNQSDPQGIVALLGAERQSATSFALAWPGRRFLFLTDQEIIDGWDLPNVTIIRTEPDRPPALGRGDRPQLRVPLSAKWLTSGPTWPRNRLRSFAQTEVIGFLSEQFAGHLLGVAGSPPPNGSWIVKGDRDHRPDALCTGEGQPPNPPENPGGLGVVYQPWREGASSLLVCGLRSAAGGVGLAALEVLSETFGREAFLLACQSIRDDDLIELSAAMLEALDHQGYFSLNWLRVGSRLLLSSLRPFPRAVMGLLRRGGIDGLNFDFRGTRVAPAGLKLLAWHHYSNYKELAS